MSMPTGDGLTWEEVDELTWPQVDGMRWSRSSVLVTEAAEITGVDASAGQLGALETAAAVIDGVRVEAGSME